MFLGEMELALLLKTRAGVALTQDLEGRPMLCELLRDTALGRDDGLPGDVDDVVFYCSFGQLVLRAGRRRGGDT